MIKKLYFEFQPTPGGWNNFILLFSVFQHVKEPLENFCDKNFLQR